MRVIILLSITFFTVQSFAQKIQLTILSNSIKVESDSLFFRYRIQNTSDTTFVLYNSRVLNVSIDENPFKETMNEISIYPTVESFVVDEDFIIVKQVPDKEGIKWIFYPFTDEQVDSLIKCDSYFEKIFTNKINYWII